MPCLYLHYCSPFVATIFMTFICRSWFLVYFLYILSEFLVIRSWLYLFIYFFRRLDYFIDGYILIRNGLGNVGNGWLLFL